MQDPPTTTELVTAVADFLRTEAMPRLTGRSAYLARVAANVLDIVGRELQQAPANDAAELERLRALLGRDGGLFELNEELCARIERGELGLDSPGLFDHLWHVTMDKVAVDQPGYSGYRRALEEGP